MSVILITGSTGLVGSEAAKFFCEKGFEVWGIDNNFRKSFFGKDGDTTWVRNFLIKNYKNYKHFNVDIRNSSILKKMFLKLKKNLKLIIHCAGQPSHDWSKKNISVDFEINARGTLNLLSLNQKISPECPFIFMSTNKVYGANPNRLKLVEKKTRYEVKKNDKFFNGIDESMSIDNTTHSFFGVSKSYADLLVQEYGRNFGMKTACFRGGCITGPKHSGAELHGFLSYLVKTSLNKKKYKIFGYKGKQVRDNIHSKDLVNCFWEFFKKPREGEVYNAGGTRYSNCSILEAISLIEKISGKEIKKKYVKQNRTGDHIWYISSMRKFKNHYPNWKQKVNIHNIIEELILQS